MHVGEDSVRLAASNIAWTADEDEAIYRRMKHLGYKGLEIAPTRLFVENPYDACHRQEAKKFRRNLMQTYGLSVVSMQSIWFGRKERLFGTKAEREALLSYTKQAIDFAATLECPNLVFGSPKNRVRGNRELTIAYEFFRTVGDYAKAYGVVVALEPNPTIYQTDFLTHTSEVISFAKEVGSKGIGVNLDLGTMLANEEEISACKDQIQWIHHVHISEPYLNPIQKQLLHEQVHDFLLEESYQGFISLEMKYPEQQAELERCLTLLTQIFGRKSDLCFCHDGVERT